MQESSNCGRINCTGTKSVSNESHNVAVNLLRARFASSPLILPAGRRAKMKIKRSPIVRGVDADVAPRIATFPFFLALCSRRGEDIDARDVTDRAHRDARIPRDGTRCAVRMALASSRHTRAASALAVCSSRTLHS